MPKQEEHEKPENLVESPHEAEHHSGEGVGVAACLLE